MIAALFYFLGTISVLAEDDQTTQKHTKKGQIPERNKA
jgi:hypothetical protein